MSVKPRIHHWAPDNTEIEFPVYGERFSNVAIQAERDFLERFVLNDYIKYFKKTGIWLLTCYPGNLEKAIVKEFGSALLITDRVRALLVIKGGKVIRQRLNPESETDESGKGANKNQVE